MFAKLDAGIIHSSIWSDPYPARILWITMLAMKDETGFVAVSRPGLIRAANITPEEFNTAIQTLESPDPDSRTDDYEGRRVARIEGGWVILNHEKYRLHDEKKKDYHREYMREWRAKKDSNCEFTKHHSEKSDLTLNSPSVSVSVSESVLLKPKQTILSIVDYLNKACNTSFKASTKTTSAHISARLKEGFTLEDFKAVIDHKKEQWYTDPKMSPYLRPQTLFGTKFESYLQEAKRTTTTTGSKMWKPPENR